ncbi:pollen receptor-like kinase 1 [Diospyros lotus]|uniref:pollen receptor-like kinase 1 n=1 Tax=Diospyros lotus TaxID=55363 RepID=UPI002256C9F1|nr:pollen receptor-like kinase 1 [Diospyros lotus]
MSPNPFNNQLFSNPCEAPLSRLPRRRRARHRPGVRTAGIHTHTHRYILMAYKRPLFVVLVVFCLQVIPSSCRSESEILLELKKSVEGNNAALSGWNTTTPPCSGDKRNWAGILCSQGRVWGLKLENLGLSGHINLEVLQELTSLKAISLMKNEFTGGLPNLRKLGTLKSLYLSDNKFSGEIEADAFMGMVSLKKLHLANNMFTGSIPLSLTILPKLVELSLEGNRFEGEIPDFKLSIMRSFNVSNNQLEGPIPPSLAKLHATSFQGNENLCGGPLQPCPSKSGLTAATIVVLVAAVLAALAVIAAIFIILRRRQAPAETHPAPATMPTHRKVASGGGDLDKMERGASSPQPTTAGKPKAENGPKLTFLRDDAEKFDLGELLKASAEVLGSGYFGASYKTGLPTGKTKVVKRYRHMNNVGREEFQEHMRRLGRLSHPNLLPILAFYYRKEEKLLVTDHVDNVSLAIHLHGNRSRGHTSPDWPTRLRIIKGIAKGLLYLYNELPSLVAPHGHLKSSNVLLNKSFEPLLTDYGLVPVVNQEHAEKLMVAHKSPEYQQTKRITKKTDVWSLGIIILETLTGKFPANYLQQEGKESDPDLATWVNSVLRQESSPGEVFDKDLKKTKNCEGEMMKLLKIGLACTEPDFEKRCDLKEAVEKIQEIAEDDLLSSTGSR